jgi:hypothetical protein
MKASNSDGGIMFSSFYENDKIVKNKIISIIQKPKELKMNNGNKNPYFQ